MTNKTNYEFEIYEISTKHENNKLRFSTLKELDEQSATVNPNAYNMVYSGNKKGESEEQILDEIYAQFDVNRPDASDGFSLSVSDVVVVDGNERTAYYCDETGFVKLDELGDKFIKKGEIKIYEQEE